MSALGDHFPKNSRRQSARRQLVPGRVVYLFCDWITDPHDKYLAIVGPVTATRPLMFVINSRICPYVQSRPHLLQGQLRISASDYDFLHHDSYINCSQARKEFDLAQILSQLEADITRLKCELKPDTKHDIITKVRNAPTLSLLIQNQIINSLS